MLLLVLITSALFIGSCDVCEMDVSDQRRSPEDDGCNLRRSAADLWTHSSPVPLREGCSVDI